VSDKARFSDTKEKFVIEIDASKVSNTLLELRVDAKTKALWQYKLSLPQKRIIKQAVIDLVRKFAETEIPEPQGSISNVYININATPNLEEDQGDTELLTKKLDITKRNLKLCEEEKDVLKKEKKKVEEHVKECEDKLKVCENKLKEIERQIALYRKGTVTDPKQVIKEIDKILSQAQA
jgi:septal ring factor EnvC (AmiA/AmiB activator)